MGGNEKADRITPWQEPNMNLDHRHAAEGRNPSAAFTFVPRTSGIANPDSKAAFDRRDLLAPLGGRRSPWERW
jgi:hypothetical protein